MNTRIKLGHVDPAAYKMMLSTDEYLNSTKIDPRHRELIKIRASQINGCSYCINKHVKDALKLGESSQKIYLLSTWKECGLFDEHERAILALTEEVTLISNGGVSEETYNTAANLFDQQLLAQIIMTITLINAWNRIGVSTLMQPSKD